MEKYQYLAAVMDLYNRKVIGYSVSRNIDTELICRALGNALHRKKKNETPIFHSDRGSQYSSNRYQAMLAQNKINGSMSKARYPYDNSPMESFFASLKKGVFLSAGVCYNTRRREGSVLLH